MAATLPKSESNPYAFTMLQTWKFSKGILLTVLVTAMLSFLVLGYGYRQQRSSEILTGVIAGLTIILGMLTAEWLRASREQVEVTRMRGIDLMAHLERYLYNFEEYMQDPLSHENSHHGEDMTNVANSLGLLARTTRWPQPNAKKIRAMASEMQGKTAALHLDAFENGEIWSLDERLEVANDFGPLWQLIWDHTSQANSDFSARVKKYRKTQRNDGIPFAWAKKPSN